MANPDVALIVTTYQRPDNLRHVLKSIALQQMRGYAIEVVVADDGSTDETARVVESFATSVAFPVRFTTHPHEGFHAARVRNEGVAATTARYLVFLDGDCLIPPDHVWQHIKHRRKGTALAGHCCYLSQEASTQVTDEAVRTCKYQRWITSDERRMIGRVARKARFYNLIRHPYKPKLFSGNFSLWRADYERVNGFDENFRGWGAEDDDFRLRLRRAGFKIRSICRSTLAYHLWHPPHPTKPNTMREGCNYEYLTRKIRFTRCINGLVKRPLESIAIKTVGELPSWAANRRLRLVSGRRLGSNQAPEIEIVLSPGRGKFSGRADCNVLAVLKDSGDVRNLARKAHVIVGERSCPWAGQAYQFHLQDFDDALRFIVYGGNPNESEPCRLSPAA